MNDHELEAKFCILRPQAIEERLQSLGAHLLHPRTFESNLRFDTPGLDLSRDKRLLRLRQDHTTRLTYKGPTRQDHGLSSRQEIEMDVSDFGTAQRILEALGYQVVVIYEKYRTTYELDHAHVTIDEMPYGIFVEIEGENPGCAQHCINTWHRCSATAGGR